MTCPAILIARAQMCVLHIRPHGTGQWALFTERLNITNVIHIRYDIVECNLDSSVVIHICDWVWT